MSTLSLLRAGKQHWKHASGVDELLNSDALQSRTIKFNETSVLRSCCSACETKLRELYKKLAKEGNGRMSRYLWPLSEKEHEKAVQSVRNFTTWIQLAL
ncbi:Uu.00g006750.m01.CDS01 [Anthostomella pinea]|uniref:Uu.00g006750.m01.CDS01 n=1 Tax=Anthostomella pinea TaxID=933095 RepID=A0AAI8VKD1_9PEZI|nr:Uu.00g006750.m01.CDS01 [Anthostomella pinea]